jgi:hypothetical protein
LKAFSGVVLAILIAAAFMLRPAPLPATELKLKDVKTDSVWDGHIRDDPGVFYRCREPWTVKVESVYFSEDQIRFVAAE